MSDKIVKLFGNDDPRIGELAEEIKKVIYARSIGVFQVATVIGVLRIVEHEILEEMKNG